MSLLSFWSRFVGRQDRRVKGSRATHSRKTRRLPLTVETLEDRCVPTAVAAPSGLVSWWTGNNTAADAIGGNTATLYNGTTFAAGEVGKAFSFDGVNDRGFLGDPDSLERFTSALHTDNDHGTIRECRAA